jgi:hypothetical protein
VRRTALIVTFAAALAVGLAGCSSETPGNATPTETADGGSTPSFPDGTPTGEETTAPSDGDSGTADLEPCDLLTAEELTALGLPSEPFEEGELGPARRCQWQASGGNGLDVAVMDDLGIDEVQSENTPRPLTIGSHDAAEYDGVLGTCVVAMAVTDSSRVDVLGTAGGDMNKACDVANQAAKLVEPKLP